MATIIVAVTPSLVIGTKENTIPWHLPDDMKFFKETTQGHPIIMGSNTWNSLPKKPLPKRTNIVVSRTIESTSDDSTFHESRPIFVDSIQEALYMVSMFKSLSEPYIIGGAQIYRSALEEKLVDKILMTHVHKDYEGTVYFPDIKDYGFIRNKLLVKHNDFNIVEYIKI